MTRVLLAAFGVVLLLPTAALAQAASPAAPAAPKYGVWIVAGPGFSAARAGCPTCDEDGVYATSYSFLVDAGMRVNSRVDVGIELLWVSLDVDGTSHVRTTFILGVAQFRPWHRRSLGQERRRQLLDRRRRRRDSVATHREGGVPRFRP